jgi:glycosyltransferase involved in cell wall biosynthesis
MIPEIRKAAPRLLYVVTEDWYFRSHRLALACAARTAGYDVHLATRIGADAHAIAAAGITVHPVPFSRSPRRIPSDLRSVRALRRIYAAVRPDVVHNVALKPIVLGALADRGARLPYVIDAFAGLGFAYASRRLLARLLRPVLDRALRNALGRPHHVTVVQNADDQRELERLGTVRRGASVVVPGAGVDLDRFAPPAQRAEGPVRVVLVARMLRDKGVGEFVAAAAALRQRGVDARFILVGEPDPENPASIPAATLERWHATGVVEWWGRRADVAQVLREAHIGCLPSYREGLPLALLEAAASGLPLVATDVPGCRDVVHAGDNGLLVPARDAVALGAALEQLIRDPGMRERFASRSRERAEEFSAARIIEAMLALYRRRDTVAPAGSGH